MLMAFRKQSISSAARISTRNVFQTVGRARYSTAQPQTHNRGPGFGRLILVGLAGSTIFVLVARSLDKSKSRVPTKEELESSINGLRRKQALLQPGDLQITFSPFEQSPQLSSGTTVINANDIIKKVLANESDEYNPLLQQVKAQYGLENLQEHLPKGLMVRLLARHIKQHHQKDDSLLITEFPHNLQDAVKFETDICAISALQVPKDRLENDIVQYYTTVGKVQTY